MEIEEFRSFQNTVATRFGDISYFDAGNGPTALFVHGLFMNGLLWRNVIGEVQGKRRCIAVDTMGHGGTRIAADQDVSLPAQAEMLEEFCDALNLSDVDLVANDTGGAIAQIFAARNASRLRTLTLTDCDTVGNLPPAPFAPVVELAREGTLGGVLRTMRDDLDFARSELGLGAGYERPQELTREVVGAYLAPLVSSDQSARIIESYVTSLDERDLAAIEPELRTLTVPTLIVWGTADAFFDVAFADWLADTIPGVQDVVKLDGAKLFFPEERPAEFAKHLKRHWAAARVSPE